MGRGTYLHLIARKVIKITAAAITMTPPPTPTAIAIIRSLDSVDWTGPGMTSGEINCPGEVVLLWLGAVVVDRWQTGPSGIGLPSFKSVLNSDQLTAMGLHPMLSPEVVFWMESFSSGIRFSVSRNMAAKSGNGGGQGAGPSLTTQAPSTFTCYRLITEIERYHFKTPTILG